MGRKMRSSAAAIMAAETPAPSIRGLRQHLWQHAAHFFSVKRERERLLRQIRHPERSPVVTQRCDALGDGREAAHVQMREVVLGALAAQQAVKGKPRSFARWSRCRPWAGVARRRGCSRRRLWPR